MKEDIRYSEFAFLRWLSQLQSTIYFHANNEEQLKIVGLASFRYTEMMLVLLEDLHIEFQEHEIKTLVGLLRKEITHPYRDNFNIKEFEWHRPREALQQRFIGQSCYQPRVTYRGLRYMEELRDMLKRGRVLEDFGILLSIRYFRKDLEDAIRRASDISVSVLYFDMDNFGIINKQHGQDAGNVVMKAYLEKVQEGVGNFGTAYRGCGDEVVALITGQGDQKAIEMAESIRQSVASLNCEHKGQTLPKVSASIGVATSPPAQRTMDLESLAESRKRQAKQGGKNMVISI